MRKLLNQPWFVGALALSALAFVVYSVMPKNSARFAAAPEDEVASETTEEALAGGPQSPTGIAAALKAMPDTPATRDPFAARARIVVAAAPVEKVPEPDVVDTVRLTALWTQGGETFALVNGRICTIGDRIGRLRVETATQDGIWVTHWKGRDFVSIGAAFSLVTPARQAAALTLSQGS